MNNMEGKNTVSLSCKTEDYLTVMSYVRTEKKHEKNDYEAIPNSFEGNYNFAFE